MALQVVQIINSPVPSNCFVLFNKKLSDGCLIVDPGSKRLDEIMDVLEGNTLQPEYILLTHEHFDHCWGCNQLTSKYNIPIVCSKECSEAIASSKRNCSIYYDEVGFEVQGKTITLGSLNWHLTWSGGMVDFFLSPGHTDSSVCFHTQKCLFTGDTLIKDTKTVTKLPTGSKDRLKETFKKLKVFQKKGYTVYPGHGEIFNLKDVNLD